MNKQLEEQIIAIKHFYAQLTRFIGASVVCILLWALTGGGYFWPIWVGIYGGLDLLYQANNLNLLHSKEVYTAQFLNITKKWEQKKIDELKQQNSSKDKE